MFFIISLFIILRFFILLYVDLKNIFQVSIVSLGHSSIKKIHKNPCNFYILCEFPKKPYKLYFIGAFYK